MRHEFSNKTKTLASIRANGKCEGCTAPLSEGQYHYDHDIPDALGGDNSLTNCRVLCKNCHGAKTTRQDVPRIAKARRNYRKARGIKTTSKFRAWRRFDGTVVKR